MRGERMRGQRMSGERMREKEQWYRMKDKDEARGKAD